MATLISISKTIETRSKIRVMNITSGWIGGMKERDGYFNLIKKYYIAKGNRINNIKAKW
jgi:hypothetical protein